MGPQTAGCDRGSLRCRRVGRALCWAQLSHCRVLARAFAKFDVKGCLADRRVLPSVSQVIVGLYVYSFTAVCAAAAGADRLVERAFAA
eukprot:1198869-Pyramimonas_sp.AAC.1